MLRPTPGDHGVSNNTTETLDQPMLDQSTARECGGFQPMPGQSTARECGGFHPMLGRSTARECGGFQPTPGQ